MSVESEMMEEDFTEIPETQVVRGDKGTLTGRSRTHCNKTHGVCYSLLAPHVISTAVV